MRCGNSSPFTQRIFFEILLNQPEIRLYLPFSDIFGIKRTSVWFQIYRGMVNTIWFQFNLIIFWKVFSVCDEQLRIALKPRQENVLEFSETGGWKNMAKMFKINGIFRKSDIFLDNIVRSFETSGWIFFTGNNLMHQTLFSSVW